jgi:murein DD-endopeptidase MepM/ murein hydrolase activator NlpD
MKSRNSRNTAVKIISIVLAVLILGSLVSGAFIMLARAASSKDILSDLNTLKQQQSEIQAQSSKLEASIADNQAKTQTLVDKKADIDQQMDLTRQQIDNLNGQIQQYSLLIAQKQDDLDQSMAQEEAMSEQYKTRLRSMEESGTISYWSILFKASSFSDLLDRVDMIKEIAASDQVMLQKLSDMSKSIEQERTELESQKTELESAKTDLNTQQATMETQRAESDKLILQMADEYASLSDEYKVAEQKEDDLSAQIKQKETAYYNALSAEEAARIAAENKKNNNKVSASSTSGKTTTATGGFLLPLPYYTAITDAYGMRYHPIYGYYKMHEGVDLAVGSGTAIYATKSGTVTTAAYDDAYGYYVTINHGDGYSSLYGHMTNYIVSAGDYVTQGQVIGYVGSTGWSTGPHLHFGIYYNGSSVNPMNYVS